MLAVLCAVWWSQYKMRVPLSATSSTSVVSAAFSIGITTPATHWLVSNPMRCYWEIPNVILFHSSPRMLQPRASKEKALIWWPRRSLRAIVIKHGGETRPIEHYIISTRVQMARLARCYFTACRVCLSVRL